MSAFLTSYIVADTTGEEPSLPHHPQTLWYGGIVDITEGPRRENHFHGAFDFAGAGSNYTTFGKRWIRIQLSESLTLTISSLKGYLITGNEGGYKSKSSCYSGSDLLWCQLKQSNGNHQIHGCLHQRQQPVIWLFELVAILFVLQPQRRHLSINTKTCSTNMQQNEWHGNLLYIYQLDSAPSLTSSSMLTSLQALLAGGNMDLQYNWATDGERSLHHMVHLTTMCI